MHFTPKSEDTIAMENLREAGVYDFTVISAIDTVSKAGKPMLKIELEVFDQQGRTFRVTDYLLESLAYKLRHFAFALGCGDAYEAGNIDTTALAGKSGRLKLIIQVDKNGEYPPKNAVKDYVVPDQGSGDSAPPPMKLTVIKPGIRVRDQAVAASTSDNEPPF